MAEAKTEIVDYAAKIEWLKRELHREQVALQGLEERRESAYLDGVDVPALLKEMNNTQERITALERNILTAESRLAAARKAAGWASIESDAAVVRELAVPRLEGNWRRSVELMLALAAVFDEIQADTAAAEAINTAIKMGDYQGGVDSEEAMFVAAGVPRLSARKPSRADLLIDLDAIRARVAGELAAAPELPPLTPFAGETQRNFNLRTLNRAARLDSMAKAGDPIKVTAEAARDAIEKTVLARSPFETTDRRVTIQKFQDRRTGGTGETIKKVQAIDGNRAPPQRITVDPPGLSPESVA
jgi:hypothetical protein